MSTAGRGAGSSDEPPLSPATSGWRRASKCATGVCVEVRQVSMDHYAIRDSKQLGLGTSQPMLNLPRAAFIAFLDELSDRAQPGSNGEIVIVRLADGDTVFRSRSTGVELRFDQGEIEAFVAGVMAGEFDPELQPAG